MENYRHYLQLILLAVLFVAANIAMYVIGPAVIVSAVGLNNIYLLVFVLAFFGTISAAAAPFFYSFLAAVAVGGVSALPLALAATSGLFLGDSLFFYLVVLSYQTVSDDRRRYLRKITKQLRRWPNWVVKLITYIYFGLTPLPNDLLMIGFVTVGYNYQRMALAMLLGDLTISLIIAYAGGIWV